MKNRLYIIITVLFALQTPRLHSQENTFTHYFAVAPFANPASAGDTRFIQVGLANRIQAMSSASPIHNTLLTFDQKIKN